MVAGHLEAQEEAPSLLLLLQPQTRELNLVGNFKNCVKVWKQFTDDPWILSSIEGYFLEFESKPCQISLPKLINFNNDEIQIINAEVEAFIKKGVIVPSQWESDQFLSNTFVVKKANGKYRPVINLRRLNKFVHFEY